MITIHILKVNFVIVLIENVTVLLIFLRPPGLLCFIDHVVGNQPENGMVSTAEW